MKMTQKYWNIQNNENYENLKEMGKAFTNGLEAMLLNCILACRFKFVWIWVWYKIYFILKDRENKVSLFFMLWLLSWDMGIFV